MYAHTHWVSVIKVWGRVGLVCIECWGLVENSAFLHFSLPKEGLSTKKRPVVSLLDPKELTVRDQPLQSQTEGPASLPLSPIFIVPPTSFTAKRWNKLMFLYYRYTSHISESIKQPGNLWNKNAYHWKKFFSFWKHGKIHVLFGDSCGVCSSWLDLYGPCFRFVVYCLTNCSGRNKSRWKT